MTHRSTRLFGFAVLPLLVGLIFFSASLTPSLIPRNWLLQGVLAGTVTAIGYMVGQFALAGWRAIELPCFTGKRALIAHSIVAVPVLVLWLYALASTASWQDTIRVRVGLEVTDDYQTLGMLAVAAATFVVFYALGWLTQLLFDVIRHRLYRIMRQRTANVLGFLLAAAVIFMLTRDGIGPWALESVDNSYEAAQKLFATAPPSPTDPRIPGSTASLIDWGAMGQPGRDFVLDGPNAEAISAFTGRPALDPIRVYVGRAQAKDPTERAEVALQEMKRLGAFDRKVLIVASPTGTGWLDPGGNDPIAYMHDGDIATVAVQYSYLQSPLALIFETRSGLDQATATLRAIYDHWKDLPPDERPEFYLHGISLGAWSSMYSFNLFQIVNDPIQGALWTGPPFPSTLWSEIVSARNPGSPYVSPTIGDGALVRFMSQYGGLERATVDWGLLRIVFMQYASDPIVFYEPTSFYREPQWMREAPAPDVSPAIFFMPIVSQFQLAVDMALSKALPQGFGHNYVAEDYIDAWVAVTAPDNMGEATVDKLKDWCSLQWGLGCRN